MNIFTKMLSMVHYRETGGDENGAVQKVEQRFKYLPINTATTTTIVGAGTLHSVNVFGGAVGTVTIYDNVVGSGAVIVPVFTSAQGQSHALDVQYNVGLTIVTSAATVIVISYRGATDIL